MTTFDTCPVTQRSPGSDGTEIQIQHMLDKIQAECYQVEPPPVTSREPEFLVASDLQGVFS